jgi:hypothetical protein
MTLNKLKMNGGRPSASTTFAKMALEREERKKVL